MARFNILRSNLGQLDLDGGVTVANLPSPPRRGMIRVVTDATSPAAGSAPTGGGSARALVWYNGAAWRVIGV
jgi:hypothetical protein